MRVEKECELTRETIGGVRVEKECELRRESRERDSREGMRVEKRV